MTGKSKDALRTIGEAVREIGVKPHILRYWEEQFPMLEPLKRAGSRRYYRPEDMDLLRQINVLLNEQGYTVKGAVKYLQSGGGKGEPTVAAPVQSEFTPAMPQLGDDKIQKLRDIREELATALAA
ncbi:MerR family transcriptional regulator [Sphingorhabdus sp. Alg239-R122]|uniref:MerR family transcriptional regulator n=1 Tax=Sphingorhabdus sp. Alg239-R122 TaxID=2305989 RepID=UPI0013DD409F|nr:MerR family transcriptional regulator [Sphingorhabdus sp. Alg239-R122]